MSIIVRPTSHTVISGAPATPANAYDNNLGTSAFLESLDSGPNNEEMELIFPAGGGTPTYVGKRKTLWYQAAAAVNTGEDGGVGNPQSRAIIRWWNGSAWTNLHDLNGGPGDTSFTLTGVLRNVALPINQSLVGFKIGLVTSASATSPDTADATITGTEFWVEVFNAYATQAFF